MMKMDENLKILKQRDLSHILSIAKSHNETIVAICEKTSKFTDRYYIELSIPSCSFELMRELFADHQLGKYDIIIRGVK